MNQHLHSHTPSRRSGATGGLVAVIFGVLALLVLPIGAAQAEGSGGSDGSTPPGKAWVRAGNFVPGMGGVSIQLQPQSAGDGMTLAQQVSYGQVTDYRQVSPGTYTVSVRPRGAAADTQPMLRRSLKVTAGKASTVALLGEQTAPRLATLTDDLTPPKPGTARVRVLSGSANAESLSIKAVNGPLIASDVVLGETTDYATVPQGSWKLALSDSGDSGANVADTTVDLASGGVYTAVVLDGDEVSNGKVKLSLVTDAQGVAQTPKGAAATGLGGMADSIGTGTTNGSGPVGPIALAGAGMVLLGLGSFGARRVSRRPSALR